MDYKTLYRQYAKAKVNALFNVFKSDYNENGLDKEDLHQMMKILSWEMLNEDDTKKEYLFFKKGNMKRFSFDEENKIQDEKERKEAIEKKKALIHKIFKTQLLLLKRKKSDMFKKCLACNGTGHENSYTIHSPNTKEECRNKVCGVCPICEGKKKVTSYVFVSLEEEMDQNEQDTGICDIDVESRDIGYHSLQELICQLLSPLEYKIFMLVVEFDTRTPEKIDFRGISKELEISRGEVFRTYHRVQNSLRNYFKKFGTQPKFFTRILIEG